MYWRTDSHSAESMVGEGKKEGGAAAERELARGSSSGRVRRALVREEYYSVQLLRPASGMEWTVGIG